MKKLVRESIHVNRKEIVTTVNELLSWYTGDENWYEDDYKDTDIITSMMMVDGEYADDHEEYFLSWLSDHKDDSINVISVQDGFDGSYNLEFILDHRLVTMQSINYALANF